MHYCVRRTGVALGDHMMAAFFVRLLNDNGIDAVYGTGFYRDLVDVPLSVEGEPYEDFFFTYHHGDLRAPAFDASKSIVETATQRFKSAFGIDREILIRTRHVPVKFVELRGGQRYDVVMCTKSGVWSRYRNWPYFEELKREFDVRGISHFDLSRNGVRGNECLNYVAASKVYLGLETGVSHYVSQVAKKGLILQSGYSTLGFWCPYLYEALSEPVPCAPCFIHCKTQPYDCPFGHQCMRNLSVSKVLARIEELLE